MRWFKNLKTTKKLVIGFAASGIITTVVGWVGLSNMAHINDDVENLYKVQLVPISYLTGMRGLTHQVRAAVILAVLGPDAATTKKAVDTIHELDGKLAEMRKKFEPTIRVAAVGEAYKKHLSAVESYQKVRDGKVLALALDGKKDEAYAAMTQGGAAAYKDLIESINEVIKIKEGIAEAKYNEAQAIYASSRLTQIGFVVVGIIVGLGFGLVIARMIAKPLGQAVQVLQSVADKDLTKTLAIDTKDEVGEMAAALNHAVTAVRATLTQVKTDADHTAVASQELSAASEQLSAGAQEQASALEETAASLEELTGTVKQTADNSRQANQLAERAREIAEQGGGVVQNAVSAMEEINRASKKIADIITTIDEIAFQTNLLALNAAVEAARAGEQGRGFAVVASEVRNLAQRSAGAAKEIKTLIQDSVQKVDVGSDLVAKSGQTLEEIVSSVKRVTDIIAEIAAASSEQSSGIDQINRAVSQMDQVTQSNAAQTEELSSTAQTLAAQSGQLQVVVNQFSLGTTASPGPDAEVNLPPLALPKLPKKNKAMPKKQAKPTHADGDDAIWKERRPEHGNGTAAALESGFEEF